MKIYALCLSLLTCLLALDVAAQEQDSLVQQEKRPAKVKHAEPLFIDLIRDLGARKGEAEWNLGFGMTDHNTYEHYDVLVEYEFAPLNRLGLEVEVPVSLYAPLSGNPEMLVPNNGINGLKTAAQYTFLVSERYQTSLAVGYIHEFAFNNFPDMRQEVVSADVENPFLVAAKRWGRHWHTLVYSGPALEREKHTARLHTLWQHNTSIHYMMPNSRNFIGLEVNEVIQAHHHAMTLRPQMRVAVDEQLVVGIAAGIPVKRQDEGMGFFIRMIYEP